MVWLKTQHLHLNQLSILEWS